MNLKIHKNIMKFTFTQIQKGVIKFRFYTFINHFENRL